MATNNNTTKLTGAATIVREEDLDELEELLREVKTRVHKSRDDGRTFMMAQYTRIVGMLSPEVTRLRKRLEREDLAAFRRDHKTMKLEAAQAAEESE
ncbi:MAG: hypothetical protein ACJ788_14090 [Ktedonobacteraceae bacterium]